MSEEKEVKEPKVLSVEQIMRKVNKEFGNSNLIRIATEQPRYRRNPMGAMGFDFPLYGGIPEGRVIQFSGKESSGKTTAACSFVAEYQRRHPDKVCVFIDVEHALDLTYIVQMTGIDLTKLFYVNPENMTGEQILDVALELLHGANIGVVVIDSVAALVSGQEYENDIEKDSGMAGNIAKSLNRFLKKAIDVISSRQSNLLVINQVRVKGTTRQGAEILREPCGAGLAFYSSVIVRFGKRTFTFGDTVDKYDGEKADGIRLWFEIKKNKTASIQRGGGFITFRYDIGLDWAFDLIEVALAYNFIHRPTSQSYVLVNLLTGEPYIDDDGNQLKFVGKQKVKDFFSENPKFQLEYINMLTEHISAASNVYGKLLDDRVLAEIESQNAKDVYDDNKFVED